MDSNHEIKLKQYALLYGWITPKFNTAMGLPTDADACRCVVDIFKRYLRISKTRELPPHAMRIFIASVLMLMSREYGVFIPDPQDGPDAEEMDMGEYLRIKQLQYDKQHRANNV